MFTGINQCARILEKEYEHQQNIISKNTTTTTAVNSTLHPKPLLVLLSKDVLRPPSSILDHITIYLRELNVPTLVLPGRASCELGQALGMKCAAVILILSSTLSKRTELNGGNNINNGNGTENTENRKEREDEQWKETNEDIDSFVSYAIHKIPKL